MISILSTSSRTLSSMTTYDSTCRKQEELVSATALMAVRTLGSVLATNGTASFRIPLTVKQCRLDLVKWLHISFVLRLQSIKSSASMSAIQNVPATRTFARTIWWLIRIKGNGSCLSSDFKSILALSTPQKLSPKRTLKLQQTVFHHNCVKIALFLAQLCLKDHHRSKCGVLWPWKTFLRVPF